MIDAINETSLAPALPMSRIVASKSSLDAFGESLLARKIDEITPHGFLSHHLTKAHHMAETFKDIHVALVAKNNADQAAAAGSAMSDEMLGADPLRKRKLTRMDIVRKLSGMDQLPPAITSHHKRIIAERSKDLK